MCVASAPTPIHKTSKAERSVDPAAALNGSELSVWTAELRSDQTGLVNVPAGDLKYIRIKLEIFDLRLVIINYCEHLLSVVYVC